MSVARREFLLGAAASLIPGPARAKASANSCIRIHLTGGPSHLDTFDPKPDAPSTIRGPFRAIRTSAPDIRISELLPRTARQAHRLALIRSAYTTSEAQHPLFPTSSTHTSFQTSCRNAIRAVEAGERFIDVPMFQSATDGLTWDMHGWRPFSVMADYRDSVAPAFDIGFSALIESLAERGLLDTTLVVAVGEFGRTPRLNPDGGRDHWPHCFTAVLAGGGVTGGQVYGSSDSIGAEPKENPVTPAMIEGFIASRMGEASNVADMLNLS